MSYNLQDDGDLYVDWELNTFFKICSPPVRKLFLHLQEATLYLQ